MPTGIKLKGRLERADVPTTKELTFQIHKFDAGTEKLVQEHRILGAGFNLPADTSKPAAWQVRFANLARKTVHRLTVTLVENNGTSTVVLRRVFKTFNQA